MGLCKVRLFPIKEINPNDYPAYNMPFKLCSSDDENINNISVTINNKVKEKTLQADDQESVSRAVTGYEGELQAYGLDADATTNLFGYQKNSDGNVLDVVNNEPLGFGLFYQGENEKGIAFQKYFYHVKLYPGDEGSKTKTESAESITLTLEGRILKIDGDDIRSFTVYEGNPGWVDGEPTEMLTSKSDLA